MAQPLPSKRTSATTPSIDPRRDRDPVAAERVQPLRAVRRPLERPEVAGPLAVVEHHLLVEIRELRHVLTVASPAGGPGQANISRTAWSPRTSASTSSRVL